MLELPLNKMIQLYYFLSPFKVDNNTARSALVLNKNQVALFFFLIFITDLILKDTCLLNSQTHTQDSPRVVAPDNLFTTQAVANNLELDTNRN